MSEEKNKIMRMDGLANALTGLSGTQDRTSYHQFVWDYMRPDEELTAIWAGGGIGRKICTSRPDDMLRAWISIPEDTDGKILKALDKLQVRTHLRDVLYWTELYRGGLMVLGGLDSQIDMEKPLTSATKPLEWIKVYPASRVLNTNVDLESDTKSPYYEDFSVFQLQKRYAVNGQTISRVHHSRCIVSKGIPVPEDKNTTFDYKYLYWGMSRLQAVFQELANASAVQKAFGNLIQEATVSTMNVQGLAEILANDDTAPEKLNTLMQAIAKMKSILNMVLMSEGDEFKRDSLSTSGWMDVAMMFRQEVAAAADSTIPRLYGIPSSGLGGGGSDEEAKKNYNDSIQADQETRLRPMLQILIGHVARELGMPEDIEFKFNPLTQQTEKEIVDNRKTTAETDKIYVDMGVLDPQEIRDSRFGGTSYSRETVLDPSLSSDDFEPDPVPPVTKVPAPNTKGAKAPTAPVPMPKTPTKGRAQ